MYCLNSYVNMKKNTTLEEGGNLQGKLLQLSPFCFPSVPSTTTTSFWPSHTSCDFVKDYIDQRRTGLILNSESPCNRRKELIYLALLLRILLFRVAQNPIINLFLDTENRNPGQTENNMIFSHIYLKLVSSYRSPSGTFFYFHVASYVKLWFFCNRRITCCTVTCNYLLHSYV